MVSRSQGWGIYLKAGGYLPYDACVQVSRLLDIPGEQVSRLGALSGEQVSRLLDLPCEEVSMLEIYLVSKYQGWKIYLVMLLMLVSRSKG